MPGLPSSNLKKDLELFKKLFSDEKFKPDQLKIYPCQVIKGSKLEEEFWKGRYRPYTKEQTEKLLSEMLRIVPRYCRVMRMMREIPPDYLIAGTTRIDLRKDIEEELRNEKKKIKEIRFREIGFNQNKLNLNLEMKIMKYSASGGKEYFLEIVNKDDVLFGLLRLRIVKDKTRESTRIGLSKTREHRSAIVRELHVYGQSLKLDEKNSKATLATSLKIRGDWKFREIAPQHKGLGKMLMKEAEKIAKKEKKKKILVISGIGVREYYKNLGYKLEDTYMVKNLKED